MKMNLELLETLIQTPSVSGFESDAVRLFCDYLDPYADDSYIGPLNNAYVCSKGVGSIRRKILIDAHIDEIGMQVVYIDSSGYLYLRRAGGVDVQCLAGTSVLVQCLDGGYISGVIGKKPVHLMSPEEKGRTIDLENHWVDTGLHADEVRRKITIGAVVVTAPNFKFLSQHRISSKSLDDKVGVYVISEVFKKLAVEKKSYDLYAVVSAQEEVGTKGITPISQSIEPDLAVCVDVDFATDVPDCSKRKYGDVELGKGVIIAKNLDCDHQLVLAAEKIAEDNAIPYQLSARNVSTGGNNASKVQLVGGGVRTLFIGIPCRYMHTPVEVCDLRDIDAAIKLITILLRENLNTKI